MHKKLFILCLAAAVLTAFSCKKTQEAPAEPAGTPSTPTDPATPPSKTPDELFASDYFQRFTDPSSGVVSYYLKSEAIGKDNSQSVYFQGCEFSNDERFLFCMCSTNETKVREGKATQERYCLIIDLKTRRKYQFPKSDNYPWLDPETDRLYYCVRAKDQASAQFYRRDLLTAPALDVELAPFPAECIPQESPRPISRTLNHITLTSDRHKVFIDCWVKDKDRKDYFIWGMLDLYSGAWDQWGVSETENVTHGQVNPCHDDEALCAIDGWDDSQKVHHSLGKDPDGTTRRLQYVKRNFMKTIMPSDENGATHEGWTADGDWVYFCGHGINLRNVRTGEYKRVLLTDLSKEQATHCHPTRDLKYWTFDDAYPDFYRGGRWKVHFLNTLTGKRVMIYSGRPAINDKDNLSTLHPDPHPHFVCGDKYIICTMAGDDLNLHLSITPVDQLIKMTSE